MTNIAKKTDTHDAKIFSASPTHVSAQRYDSGWQAIRQCWRECVATELARPELVEGMALARRIQQPALVAEAAWWLAELDQLAGEREAACTGFREALAIYGQQGNPDAAITRERLRKLGCEP